MEEARKERDILQQECEELKVQLHLAEDRFDSTQTQLQETSRKLKEGIDVNLVYNSFILVISNNRENYKYRE